MYLPAKSKKVEEETRLKGFGGKAGVALGANGNYVHKEIGGKDFLSFPIRHFMFQSSSSIEVQL